MPDSRLCPPPGTRDAAFPEERRPGTDAAPGRTGPSAAHAPWGSSPILPGLEKETELEERTKTVLATAQILRGKLNRSDEGLARDAFDLISAAKADRRALQHAINALNDRQMLIICDNLISTNDDMAKSAADALHGTTSEFETDQGRLWARTLANGVVALKGPTAAEEAPGRPIATTGQKDQNPEERWKRKKFASA